MSRISLFLITVFSLQAGAADLPLFASDEMLDIVIEVPMKTLVRERDDRPVLEGTISYVDESGETVSIGMTLTTRGKSRLAYCSFPPLSLNLKRNQAKDTLFDGQNKLKLTKLAMQQSEESLRIRTNRFTQGLEKTTDLLLAETQLSQKQLDYYVTIFQHNYAMAYVQFLTKE